MTQEAVRPDRRTIEQVRDDIDSGRGGDKVPAADPAAVPLGADDEAAGVSARPSGEDLPPGTGPGPVKAHSQSSAGARTMRVAGIAVVGIILAVVLAVLVIQ